MAELFVRDALEADGAARREILEVATGELRGTYRPRECGSKCGGAPSGVLVALLGEAVVGTAEYVIKDDHVYVQGVAVHPNHRRSGACRALLAEAEKIARTNGLGALALCAIEETGNARIFEKMGFGMVSRSIAKNHVSPSGGPVTQVEMERKVEGTSKNREFVVPA
jgi:GNAT superfamily N-acetyltransferase